MVPRSRSAAALAAALAALVSAPAAQDLGGKGAPQERPVGIRGATLHTVGPDGVLAGGAILLVEGRIAALFPPGARPTGPPDTEWIDVGADAHVYPGFVAFASSMGTAEVGSVDMTIDFDEAGAITPEARAGVAINADSWNIPVTRAGGVLTAGVMPGGGRVPGRATVVRLDGWTWRDMELLPDAGLVVSWPSMGPFDEGGRGRGRRGQGGGSPEERRKEAERSVQELTDLFDAALAHRAARRADPSVPSDLRLEAVAPAAAAESRTFLQASALADIESAVSWAAERGLDYVIVGGRDAGLCTDLLARHRARVALSAPHRLPRRRDVSYAWPYELPGVLRAAGIPFCLTYSAGSWQNANQRNLPYEAAACIPHGLDEDAALRAITLSAAELLGVEREVGSLEVGKRATLFLADGDALEPTTSVLAAWIDGRAQDLTTKQTALYEKYRTKYRELGRLKE